MKKLFRKWRIQDLHFNCVLNFYLLNNRKQAGRSVQLFWKSFFERNRKIIRLSRPLFRQLNILGSSTCFHLDWTILLKIMSIFYIYLCIYVNILFKQYIFKFDKNFLYFFFIYIDFPSWTTNMYIFKIFYSISVFKVNFF